MIIVTNYSKMTKQVTYIKILFILGHFTCRLDICIGNIGGDPPYREESGGVPPPGGTDYCSYKTMAMSQWGLVLIPAVVGNEGGGHRVYGDLYL